MCLGESGGRNGWVVWLVGEGGGGGEGGVVSKKIFLLLPFIAPIEETAAKSTNRKILGDSFTMNTAAWEGLARSGYTRRYSTKVASGRDLHRSNIARRQVGVPESNL